MRSIHSFRCWLTCSLSRAYAFSQTGNLHKLSDAYLAVQCYEEVWVLFGPWGQTNIMDLLVGTLLSPEVEVGKVLQESAIL